MAEQATERTTIAAPPDVVYGTALDIEHYPEWAHDIKEATIVERDEEGRPLRVRFRAAAMGHSARYVLRYDYSEAPRRMGWILEQGDIVRKLDGEYVFEPAANGGTEVTYKLVAELAVPLPGFIKRRAESKIMTTALEELRHRCEDAAVR
jgi:ribosome-associated toxin RatA of RatAB toxin-antitoxin module